jgi:hypothetical protein
MHVTSVLATLLAVPAAFASPYGRPLYPRQTVITGSVFNTAGSVCATTDLQILAFANMIQATINSQVLELAQVNTLINLISSAQFNQQVFVQNVNQLLINAQTSVNIVSVSQSIVPSGSPATKGLAVVSC